MRQRGHWFARALGLFCAWAAGLAGAAALEVVATTPDLKSIAEAVGGAHVSVTSLAAPGADPETFQPRPQDLARLRRAAVVVRVGLDFDLWLDPLLRSVGRPELRKNGSAHIDASQGIAVLEIRAASLDSSAGHTHGAGNPHYWLDPVNAEVISANISETLTRIDPANHADYAANRARFVGALRQRLPHWQRALAALSGRPLLAYHDTWPYFARRFRLHIADVIEPKPGIAPSPARLAELTRLIRAQNVAGIVVQTSDPAHTAEFLARRSGVRVARLASSVGAVREATNYIGMIDHNVGVLSALAR